MSVRWILRAVMLGALASIAMPVATASAASAQIIATAASAVDAAGAACAPSACETLDGTVDSTDCDAASAPASWYVHYATTEQYTTPGVYAYQYSGGTLAPGGGAVHAVLSELTPAMLHHVSLEVRCDLAAVSVSSADATFTTPAVAGPGGDTPTIPAGGTRPCSTTPYQLVGHGRLTYVGSTGTTPAPIDAKGAPMRGDIGSYHADGVTVIFHMGAVVYTLAPGSTFKPMCFGRLNPHTTPQVMLYSGRVDVSVTSATTPREQSLQTSEGAFHTDVAGKARYSVTRQKIDSAGFHGVDVMRVQLGRNVTFTPFRSKVAHPCRAGRGIKVDGHHAIPTITVLR